MYTPILFLLFLTDVCSGETVSSLGFKIHPRTIVQAKSALRRNATILKTTHDLKTPTECEKSCSLDSKCNLFVFSAISTKCIIFDCKSPSVCNLEDGHESYTTGVKARPPQDCYPLFQCVTRSQCVPMAYTCDGVRDCEDNSDESGCFPEYYERKEDVAHSNVLSHADIRMPDAAVEQTGGDAKIRLHRKKIETTQAPETTTTTTTTTEVVHTTTNVEKQPLESKYLAEERDDSGKHPFFSWLSGVMSPAQMEALTTLDIFKLVRDACMSIPERGPCGSPKGAYFYNAATRSCDTFIYSSCSVSLNRFPDESNCHAVCDSITSADQESNGVSHEFLSQKSDASTEPTSRPDYRYTDTVMMKPEEQMTPSKSEKSRLRAQQTTRLQAGYNARQEKYDSGELGRYFDDESSSYEEPVVWETYHHSSNKHSDNIQGKSGNKEEVYTSRLVVEDPAIISKPEGRRVNALEMETAVDSALPVTKQPQALIPVTESSTLLAVIPLLVGIGICSLLLVLLSIRCYFWRKSSPIRFGRFTKDPDDYLINGMYL